MLVAVKIVNLRKVTLCFNTRREGKAPSISNPYRNGGDRSSSLYISGKIINPSRLQYLTVSYLGLRISGEYIASIFRVSLLPLKLRQRSC
jgi:hypothetical protein